MSISTEKHSEIAVTSTLSSYGIVYNINDILCLDILVIKSAQRDLFTDSSLSPELFSFSALVICNNCVSGIENSCGGTVILLKLYYLCVGIGLIEIEYIADCGSSEFIN